MSKGRVLVCDIQGVGCYFTDPQIHSVDGDAFGSGNCGQDGIVAFFESHKCNSLCRRLGQFLPAACTTIVGDSHDLNWADGCDVCEQGCRPSRGIRNTRAVCPTRGIRKTLVAYKFLSLMRCCFV